MCLILLRILFLHIRVGAQNGLCQALCLVTKLIEVGILFSVAENDAHTAAYVSLWFSENADTGMILYCRKIRYSDIIFSSIYVNGNTSILWFSLLRNIHS